MCHLEFLSEARDASLRAEDWPQQFRACSNQIDDKEADHIIQVWFLLLDANMSGFRRSH